jgi:hypothetical protein
MRALEREVVGAVFATIEPLLPEPRSHPLGCHRSLAPMVAALGAGVSDGTVDQAPAARIVAIAAPLPNGPAAVTGQQWNGQTVVDATNAWNADLGGRTSSEIVADLVPGVRLLKAAGPWTPSTREPTEQREPAARQAPAGWFGLRAPPSVAPTRRSGRR